MLSSARTKQLAGTNLIQKEKKVNLSYIVNIVICASSPASKLSKIPAKPCYSLVCDLHGM